MIPLPLDLKKIAARIPLFGILVPALLGLLAFLYIFDASLLDPTALFISPSKSESGAW